MSTGTPASSRPGTPSASTPTRKRPIPNSTSTPSSFRPFSPRSGKKVTGSVEPSPSRLSKIPKSNTSTLTKKNWQSIKKHASAIGLTRESSQSSNSSGSTTRSFRAKPPSLNQSSISRANTPTGKIKSISLIPADVSETEGDFESCASSTSDAGRDAYPGGSTGDDDGSETEAEMDASIIVKPELATLQLEPSDSNGEELEDVFGSTTTPPASKFSANNAIKHHQPDSSEKDGKSENVVVCVRVRPSPNNAESEGNSETADESTSPAAIGSWRLDSKSGKISLSDKHTIGERRGTVSSESANPSDAYHFTVDRVFSPHTSNDEIYDEKISPIVHSAMDGFNGTVLVYGQTCSGKTWTMSGDSDNPGIIPQAVNEVFDVIRSEDSARDFLLRIAYLEIYNESLKDLLDPDSSARLDIRVDKGRVQVSGLKEEVVTHPEQVMEAIRRGEANRHVGATDWNERSSRSHTVFTMTIESRGRTPPPSIAGLDAADVAPSMKGTRISQLNLIDLAGSESAASSSDRRKEGAYINRSLLALGTVIAKLTEKSGGPATHIPYRDSKLTRLLQTSLGGNAKVAMVCTISPNPEHVTESLSTLRFARRAKLVVTKAERGTTLGNQSALLQKYQQEIVELRGKLDANKTALDGSLAREQDEEQKRLAGLKDERKKAEEDVADMQIQRISLQEQIEHLNRRILTSKTVDSNIRRASQEHGQAGISLLETPSRRRGRMSDFGVGDPSASPRLMHVGGRGHSRLSNILESVGSPRVGTLEREVALEKDLETAKKDATDHLSNLCAKDVQIKQLEDEVAVLKDELEVAKTSADQTRKKTEALQTKSSEFEVEIALLKDRIESISAEAARERAAQTVAPNTDMPAHGQSTIDSAATDSQPESPEAKITEEHLDNIAALQAEKEDLKVALSTAEAGRDLDKKLLERKDQELDTERSAKIFFQAELEDSLEGRKLIFSQAEAQMNELHDERDRSKQEVADVKERLADTERLLHIAREEATTTAQHILDDLRRTRDEVDLLQDQTRSQRIEIESMQAEREGSRQDVSSITDRLADAERLLRTTQDEARTATVQISDDLRRKRGEVDVLQDENRAQRVEMESMLNELQTLREHQRHSIQAASLSQSSSTNLENLKAKIAALQRKSVKSPESVRSISPSSQPDTVAQGMETIVELQITIDEQKVTIEKLQRDLEESHRRETKAIVDQSMRPDLGSVPSPLRPRPISMLSSPGRFNDDGYSSMRSLKQSPIQLSKTPAAELEIERLNKVIESQKGMLIDARTDMAKWQSKVRSQAAIIARIQTDTDDDARSTVSSISNLPTLQPPPRPESTKRTKLSAQPSTNRIQELSPIVESRFGSPISSRTTRSMTPDMRSSPSRSGSEHMFKGMPWIESSPRPLPQAPNASDDSASKKSRRLTIENDIERLKQDHNVERKKTVLLSPRPSPAKPRRILSGLGIKATSYSAEDMFSSPLTPTSTATPLPFETERSKKGSNESDQWYC